jgi:hypothetical protein
VNDKPSKDDLGTAIERGHFSKAASLAASLGLPEGEIQDLRVKSLWQMAAVYRNSPGTKLLAQQYGLSKQQVRELLQKYGEEEKRAGNTKPLEPCYDLSSGAHLSFEEWMEQFMKRWEKLPVS